MTLPRLASTLIAAALVLCAGVAHADSTEADALIQKGLELRRGNRDAEALEVFERAKVLAPSPRTRAQIGLAHQALGHWIDAETSLREALAANDDPWIESRRSPLHAALAIVEAHLGWVEVETTIEGAELWLNGSLASALPLAGGRRVVAGPLSIEIRASGQPVVVAQIVVRAGEHAHVSLPAPQPEPAPAVALEARPQTTDAPVAAARGAIEVDHKRGIRPGTWIVLAAGGVLVTGGVVANVVRERSAAAYNDDALCYHGGVPRAERCASELRVGHTAETLMLVGYISGAATIASALVAEAVLRPSSSDRASRIACAPSALGALGAYCSGRF